MTRFLVFDNTPLSHFARAESLAILESLVDGWECEVPIEVREEIMKGQAAIPVLAEVLSASWLKTVELTEVTELATFARYKTELGGGPFQNTGEAAVMAWAKIHGGVAILDEIAGNRLARRDGIEVHGSLWLVVGGLKSGVLNRREAEQLVDDLRATNMRLPIDGKGLFSWANESGLLP